MISLLSRLFIKNHKDYENPRVRQAYGTLCGAVGICLNILLFLGKYFAGTISGSIAIVADSFNNLSDAGSSLITLLGFRLAGKKPDPDHPYGHGRIEYISGLIVSFLILLMGFELAKSSIGKIIAPEPIQAGWLPAAILVASICVKVYMFLYNRSVGRKIDSAAMIATATDSLSDSIATTVVLLSMIVAYFFRVNIDGWAGLLVALFILYAGYGAAKDTLAPLLGQAPDPELVQRVNEIVMAHPEVLGIHDLVVHDYGPGRKMVTLHTEVDGKGDFFTLHDAIDNIERELTRECGCHATIHMDPIESDNEEVLAMREKVARLVQRIDPAITIHDFRIVPGKTHTNVIFDAVVPAGLPMTEEAVAERIRLLVADAYPDFYAVVDIDQAYI
jgi:cation diffusion facilitator family transporter